MKCKSAMWVSRVGARQWRGGGATRGGGENSNSIHKELKA